MSSHHSSSHVARSEKNQKKLKIVLALTSVYLVAEVLGGIWTGSLALLADAGHMLTDAGGLVLALFAIKISTKKATPEKTYGYYRAEILAALANAIVLIFISIYILYEAYQRFIDPPQIATGAMSVIAVIGLLVNFVGLSLLKQDSKESLNMKGAYFEVLSDFLTSIGVLLASAIMWMTGWYYADPLISAAIGLFILPRTWSLLKEAVGILLEGTPSGINISEIRETLKALENVNDIHDLHVWSLASGINAMSVHIVRNTVGLTNPDIERIQKLLKEKFGIFHSTIQIEEPGLTETETHI